MDDGNALSVMSSSFEWTRSRYCRSQRCGSRPPQQGLSAIDAPSKFFQFVVFDSFIIFLDLSFFKTVVKGDDRPKIKLKENNLALHLQHNVVLETHIYSS
jgi:hypothetical protein